MPDVSGRDVTFPGGRGYLAEPCGDHPEAARDAWARTIDFFGRYLR